MAVTRLTIRVKPGAASTRVGGAYGEALAVAVRPRAAEGKATEAALVAVAEALGVRRRDVRLISGAKSRTKVLEVSGTDGLDDRVRALRRGASR